MPSAPDDPFNQVFRVIDERFADLEGSMAALVDLAVSRAFALNHFPIGMEQLTPTERQRLEAGDLMAVVQCWERRICVLQSDILAQGGAKAPDSYSAHFAAGYDRIRKDFRRASE